MTCSHFTLEILPMHVKTLYMSWLVNLHALRQVACLHATPAA